MRGPSTALVYLGASLLFSGEAPQKGLWPTACIPHARSLSLSDRRGAAIFPSQSFTLPLVLR
jgi:hypothetical protein